MANVANNSLAGFLQVYALKSLPAFAADLPPRDLWTENFDSAIASEGTAVVTRIPTTVFGSLNDLSSGWESQQASASAVTVTLKTKGHDHIFDLTQWATVGEQQLLNTFTNILAKQVANGITANVINNVSSSFYTNTYTVNSSSVYALADQQAIGAKLDNLEIPQSDRYVIMNPTAYQSMIGGMYQTYVYGDPTVVRYNGFKDVNGNALNSSNPGLYVAGFNTFKYPRFTNSNLPYGGDYYTSGDTLIGFAGNKAGIAVAARTPVTVDTPLVQSYTVIEPTSGWPIQFIMAFDTSKPGWRIGIYTLFGSAQGNPKAIVPILSKSV